MRRCIVLFVALTAAATGALASSAETEFVWRQYVIAQNRLYYELFELCSHRWPDLPTTLSLQRDQQLASIAIRDLKFRHLLEHDPGRLRLDRGLPGLAGFEWTEADAEALRETHPEFVQLESFLKMIERDMAADAKMDVLRRRMMALQDDRDYRRVMRRFNAHVAVLESSLLAPPLPID
ncbi:MAG: hypothetical protein OEO21_01150 [Candidatus Krumholzibacteria bacterium]|nr:hypothetical protein [Candidatus Krumholzibacteria bacterium]